MNQQRPRPDFHRRPPPRRPRPQPPHPHHAPNNTNVHTNTNNSSVSTHPYNPHHEIPAHHRRTLILSHIPPTLTYHGIRHHFNSRGMTCDYCTVDRNTNEAYVKFRERGDVLSLWEGGDTMLDYCGNTDGNTTIGDDNDDRGLSLFKAGVKIKAIHWTNQVPRGGNTASMGNSQNFKEGQQQLFYDRKRSWDGRRDGELSSSGGRGDDGLSANDGGRGRNNNGGRGDYGTTIHGRGGRVGDDTNKMSRNDYYSTPNSEYNSKHHHQQQPGSYQSRSHSSSSSHHPSHDNLNHHASANNDSESNSNPFHSNSNHDSNTNSYSSNQPPPPPPPQTSSPTRPIQIHSSQTVHSPAQTSWRRNPKHSIHPSQQQHQHQQDSKTISTLQQKLVLLQQQESALQKQLALQKKMLSVLKQKSQSNATNNDGGATTLTKDDQTKKLKEILNTQTKITELKKERMGGLKELDGLKQQQQEFTSMVGMKTRVVSNTSANDSMSTKKLDMRSKVLKVEGIKSDGLLDESLQKSMQEHFASYGSVTDISFQNDETDESKSPFALVTFASRSDAEKAKASNDPFHSTNLICTWHKTIPFAKSDETGANETETNPNDYNADGNDEALDSFNDIYDDIYEEGTPLDKNGGPDYEDEEELMVDYD